MKKYIYLFLGAVAILCSSCRREVTLDVYKPQYMSLNTLRSSVAHNTSLTVADSGKIYIYSNYILVNDKARGVLVVDNSDPSSPQKLAYITIPGNYDMAVRNDILYADSYVDLIALDISDPQNVTLVKRISNVFPCLFTNENAVYDIDNKMKFQAVDPGRGIVTNWVKVDSRKVIIDGWGGFYLPAMYADAGTAGSGTVTGTAGSLSRFTISSNYLYTVDQKQLHLFNITAPQDPQAEGLMQAGFDIETIFAHDHALFIGAQSGLYIYDNTDPAAPVQKSSFWHITSYDPVVVESNLAYVTLRSQSEWRDSSLEIIDISSLSLPSTLISYTLSDPYGLAIDNNRLVVCDGNAGLKLYDVANVSNIIQRDTVTGYKPYDVIMASGRAVVAGQYSLYQYSYTNGHSLSELSVLDL